jgi:hypothetical protein
MFCRWGWVCRGLLAFGARLAGLGFCVDVMCGNHDDVYNER